MSNQDFIKRVLVVILVIILLLSLWYLRQIWILAFASIVIAIGLSVPAKFLQAFNISRGLSMAISAVTVFLLTILVFNFLLPPLFSQLVVIGSQLPDMMRSAYDAYEVLRANQSFIGPLLPPLDFSDLEKLVETLGFQTGDTSGLLRTIFNSSTTILGPLFDGLGFFTSLMGNIFFVALIAIFFLIEPTKYLTASLYLVPRNHQSRLLEIWDELYDTLTTWIALQTFSITMTIALVYIIMGLLLQMPFALVVAVFAGLATFIPNIGAFLPVIPIAIFTIADPSFSQNPYWLLIYIGVYLAIQLFESNVLSPIIIKAELDIPSGALLLFQVICATLFGTLGLLLAVPLLAVLIALVREIYSKDMLGFANNRLEVVSTPGRALRIDYYPNEENEV